MNIILIVELERTYVTQKVINVKTMKSKLTSKQVYMDSFGFNEEDKEELFVMVKEMLKQYSIDKIIWSDNKIGDEFNRRFLR